MCQLALLGQPKCLESKHPRGNLEGRLSTSGAKLLDKASHPENTACQVGQQMDFRANKHRFRAEHVA